MLLPFLVYAQQGVVGINNSNPKATLDISATPNSNIAIDGMIAPRIKGSELKSKNGLYSTDQEGAIVYLTEPLSINETDDKTINVLNIGYYYFDKTVGENGRWVGFKTEKPFTAFKSNNSQYVAYGLNHNPDNYIPVKFTSSNVVINQTAIYDVNTSTFNLLYDGYYEISGTVCFNPGRADVVNSEEGHGNITEGERIVLDIIIQYSTDNGTTWVNFNGVRKSYERSNADLSQPNSTPIIAKYFNKFTLIRMIINKPDGLGSVDVAGTDSITGNPTTYNNIVTPTGLDFTKLIRIVKIK